MNIVFQQNGVSPEFGEFTKGEEKSFPPEMDKKILSLIDRGICRKKKKEKEVKGDE